MKRKIVCCLFAVLLITIVWLMLEFCGGVTHRELKTAVEAEGAETRTLVEERCNALERKLDRIEAKLDRILELATPKLPDGMQPAP